jgi:putative transposase
MDNGGYRIADKYATYFLTFSVVGWIDLFTRKECKDILIESFKYCQEHKGLMMYAFVLMESHLHLIASADHKSTGLSDIIRDYKKFTSKRIIQWIQDNKVESRREWLDMIFKYFGKYNSKNSTYQVWQQDNCPKVCLMPEFTLQKVDYIHLNPVVTGIVDHPTHYRYSSARNYAQMEEVVLDVIVLDYGSMDGYVSNWKLH